MYSPYENFGTVSGTFIIGPEAVFDYAFEDDFMDADYEDDHS